MWQEDESLEMQVDTRKLAWVLGTSGKGRRAIAS